MNLYNDSGLFAQLIVGLTNHITGDLYLTLLTIMFLIIMFFFALRIPIELTVILIVPLLIVFMAYMGGDWKTIAGIFMLYISIMVARFFMR